MRASVICVWIGAVCTLTSGALSQSLNIRFGTAVSAPSPAYAAAGLPGVWNSFVVTPGYATQPLVGLNGAPVAAQYYQYGNSSMLMFNNPLTAGDDDKLMDSMILSTNNPTDGCFWVQGLANGSYEVTIYAMTPNDPSLLNRTRVDFGSPGPTMVGGTWPGHHQQGVTYARFTVTTTNGLVAFHDGLAGAVIQSGMNGVQLRFLGACSAPATYCTAKTNSLGCVPSIGSSGSPSMSSASPFWVTATNVINHKNGLMFYGFAASTAPFQDGTLCVLPPTQRTPIQDSAGSATGDDCSGSYGFDMNARIQSGIDTNLVAGALVFCQYWMRDPSSASTTGLTDGLSYSICP